MRTAYVSTSSARRRVHLGEPGLELRGADEIGALEVSPKPALVQAEQQLLAGALVDLIAVGPRAELGPQRRRALVLRSAADEQIAEAAVELVVEMVGCQRRELGDERRVADDARRVGRARAGDRPRGHEALRPSPPGVTTSRAVVAGASPASVSRGRSSRSASSRSASWRSGESSTRARTSRARTNASCRSSARSSSIRTR